MKYARIDNGLVVEFFETSADITTMFHPDLVWVGLDGVDPQPLEGWSGYKEGGDWVFKEPVIQPPTNEELKASALAQRDVLLAAANEKTAGMGDAYMVGLLDEADTATFKAYAAYKLALNKIEHQPKYPSIIAWPVIPTA